MTTIRTMPTERLLLLLPHASGVLRERIEVVLKTRFAGTQDSADAVSQSNRR